MSIRIKLSVILALLVAVPLLCVSLVVFINYHRSLGDSRIARLQELARSRAEGIETYIASLKAGMSVAQGFYNASEHLPVRAGRPGRSGTGQTAAEWQMLDSRMRRMTAAMGLADILLADSTGRVVYTGNTRAIESGAPLMLDSVLRAPLTDTAHGARVVDLTMDSAYPGRQTVCITAAALGLNGRPVGTIVFEIDMDRLHAHIRDTSNLGASGEVYVARKRGDDIVFLLPLRHDPDAAMKKSVRIGGTVDVPIQKGVAGESGAGSTVDYRGRKVVAAWRNMPVLGWGLVARIDRREEFAPVANLQRLLVIVLVVTLAISLAVVLCVARSIVVPIQRLSRGVECVGSGDLDFRVGTGGSDEIGQLSRSFDKMTSDLKVITASRDDLNREIAQREKAQQGLRVTTEELRRSNNDLEQFAHVASHDLQEPLRAVGGFVGLLRAQYSDVLDAQAHDYMDLAVRGAERMQNLIQDLLAYSHVRSKGGAFASVSLRTALDDALRNLKPAIDESHALITVDALPEVWANAAQMTQLLRNLVGNALKFRGEQPPVIHISAQRRDAAWETGVSDNGIGIEPQYFARIFLIFQRLHSRSTYQGTGIGLALCKRIVEQHGGSIRVVSRPAEGSTFYFTIPDSKEHT